MLTLFLVKDVPLLEFKFTLYLLTCHLLLCLCDICRALINSLVCGFLSQVARLPHIEHLSKAMLLEIFHALADEMSESRLCQDMSNASLSDHTATGL